MNMEMYIDASSEGYGDILLGDFKIVVMFSCTSTRQYTHCITSELEGLVRALREFFFVGEEFTVFSTNWSVLRVPHGTTMVAPVIRRFEEIMSWYP